MKSAGQALLSYRNFVREAFEGLKLNEEKKANGSVFRTTDELIKEIHKTVLPHIQQPVLSPLLLPQRVLLNYAIDGPLKNIPISQVVTSMTPVSLLCSILEKHLQ